MERPPTPDWRSLPALGLGLSTEHGAARTGLDPLALRRAHPSWASFLELGVETARGLDEVARAWVAARHPTTYHFLDVNLDDPEDLDDDWLAAVQELVAITSPAWLCGDAGLWHFGRRERGHMLLLPPVLTVSGADRLADGVAALREATGRCVLPENPPGTAFVGDMHLLDFYARLAERADTGLLLDVAHLAIYQRVTGQGPLTALDGFPADRVVEIHVAGAKLVDHLGWVWPADDHSPEPLPDTWAILEALLPRATGLRAVVYECERNTMTSVAPGFARLYSLLAREAPWALAT